MFDVQQKISAPTKDKSSKLNPFKTLKTINEDDELLSDDDELGEPDDELGGPGDDNSFSSDNDQVKDGNGSNMK